MEIKKRNHIIFNIVAIICIVLFCASISPKTLQNDTYYTIKLGEYLMENGISDLTEDPFSVHDLPYTYPHWLYNIGVYLIYDNFGHVGIYASTMILAALLGVSVYMLCSKVSRNKVISFIFTICTIYLIKDFIAARAQLVTFLLFTLTVYSIEMFLETHKKRYAVYLLIIPLLIANLHCAVFPVYFVLFLPYIAEFILLTIIDLDLDERLFYLIFRVLKRVVKKEESKNKFDRVMKNINANIENRHKKREILKENPYKVIVKKDKFVIILILIALVAGLTGFINPAGTGAYTYLYKSVQGNTMNSINEHQPMILIHNKEFLMSLVLFLSILVFTDTKIKLSDLFMLLGLTYLTFQTKRQITMYALLCVPILVKLIASMFEKYDSKTCDKLLKFGSSLFGVIVIVSSFVTISAKNIEPKLKTNDYVDTWDYPVEASEWILSNLDLKTIKLFNQYNYGSYLLFKGIPVFIDSRADVYDPQFYNDKRPELVGKDLFSDALGIDGLSENYKNKFPDYGVTHAILYSNSKLAMILKSDPDYNIIYDEGHFMIFERIIEDSY